MRIVSQSLASDEMLFPMVAPERLVGLSSLSRDPKYSNVVAEATRHPAPSIETAEDIVRLKPDLIFVTTYSRAEVVEVLESTGAPVYRLANFDDFAGVMTNLRRIGAAVGEEEAAERMVAEMQRAARRRGGAPGRPSAAARAVLLRRVHRRTRHHLRRHRAPRRRHQRGGRPRASRSSRA